MQEQNKTNNNKIHTNTCFADWINDLNPALHKYCYPFADVCERSFQLNSFHYVFFHTAENRILNCCNTHSSETRKGRLDLKSSLSSFIFICDIRYFSQIDFCNVLTVGKL